MSIIVHANIFKKTIENRIYKQEVFEHADYDNLGNDIVCAVVLRTKFL